MSNESVDRVLRKVELCIKNSGEAYLYMIYSGSETFVALCPEDYGFAVSIDGNPLDAMIEMLSQAEFEFTFQMINPSASMGAGYIERHIEDGGSVLWRISPIVH